MKKTITCYNCKNDSFFKRSFVKDKEVKIELVCKKCKETLSSF